MHWYLITRDPEVGPYVLFESVDEAWAKDAAWTWRDSVVLSDVEAALDPDFAPVVETWQRRDDSAHSAFEGLEDMEDVLDKARIEAIKDGLVEIEGPPASTVPGLSDESREIVDRITMADDPLKEAWEVVRSSIGVALSALDDEEQERRLARWLIWYVYSTADRPGARLV